MAKRTVKAALFRYRDAEGSRRLAFFGDEVELPKHELDRGEQLGVFEPVAVGAVASAAVERALKGKKQRAIEPVAVGVDELPVPPHDVTAEVVLPEPEAPAVLEAVEQPASGGPLAGEPEPGVEQPSEDDDRPAKSAKVEVWEKFVGKRRPDLTADEIKAMNKDELQAAVSEV